MKAILAAIAITSTLALSATCARASETKVVGVMAGAFVCTTEDALEPLSEFSYRRDTKSIESFIANPSNGCHKVAEETPANASWGEGRNGMVHIKSSDSDQMYWVYQSEIDPNYSYTHSKDYKDPGAGYTPKIPTHVPSLPSVGVMSAYDVACSTEEEIKSAMGELNRGGISALSTYMKEHSPSCGAYDVGAIVKVDRVDGAYAQIRATGRYAVKYGDGSKGVLVDVNAKPNLVQWTLAESINFGH